jgi:glycine hydroxymethyltransferase
MSNATQAARFSDAFFNRSLADADPALFGSIQSELGRQRHEIELIASENIVSRAVLEAQGSVMTNKYAEGYPGRRYYGGCHFVDIAEELAIERACKQLFGCGLPMFSPIPVRQANQAVLLALAKPGDTLLGMSLDAGGHLTHGARPNLSGKWFNAVQYGLDLATGTSTMIRSRRSPTSTSRRIIIAGGSAYSRQIDFARFRAIADAVDAILWVDMAHFAGLVAGGAHPSPFPHAHVATSTTHKTLRGPRGGIVLTNDEDIAKKINSAVFPGLQGGPLMHVIAAKAVAFGEALTPEFKSYIGNVVRNAEVLAETLGRRGLEIVSGGTDTHLMLVDLRPKSLTGKASEAALGRAFITCNKNGVPNDPEKPTITSGVRLGTPAGTTRGFGEAEFREIGKLILEVLDGLKKANSEDGNAEVEAAVKAKVVALTDRFPIYPHLGNPHALSLLRFRRQPGEGFAARRRRRRDPQAPGLPRLRRPLHHLRARAAARSAGAQEDRPAGALRSRQAGEILPDRAAQASGRSRAHRSRRLRHRAPAGKLGRDRNRHRRDRPFGA